MLFQYYNYCNVQGSIFKNSVSCIYGFVYSHSVSRVTRVRSKLSADSPNLADVITKIDCKTRDIAFFRLYRLIQRVIPIIRAPTKRIRRTIWYQAVQV